MSLWESNPITRFATATKGNGQTFGPWQTGVAPFLPIPASAEATPQPVRLECVVNTLGVGGGYVWSYSDDNVSYTALPNRTASAVFSPADPARRFWKCVVSGDGTTSMTLTIRHELVQDRPILKSGDVVGG